MDNGEVIHGLNEGWNFLGANVTEWIAGFLMTLFIGSAFRISPMGGAPIFVGTLGIITFGLAGLRKGQPDGIKGVANMFMCSLGLPPPGIPKPASIQPFWSGAPIKKTSEKKDYAHLNLDEMFDLIYEEKNSDE